MTVRWRPELGRWRLLEHGFPEAPQKVALSTAGVPERESYDYWRTLAFADFEADAMPAEGRRSFRARGTGLLWTRADFLTTDSGAISGRRGARQFERDGLDSISIGLVLDGQRRSEQEGDEQITLGAGGLFVYDGAHASQVSWTRHKGIFMVVRRPDVLAALDEVPKPSEMMRRLARSPMRHVIADQFRMLARHMDFLSPNEQAYVLDQTIQLALFALGNPSADQQVVPPDGVLFHAALRFIELNLADPNLDAARVAKAVNCSRATLYRAFAAEGTGVAEAIRDMRLDRARILIEQMPPGQSIGDVAVSCGLYDTANFSRQFRRRFGFAPSDFRPTASRPAN
jgi:AraC family transcriptional regulator, positive regulator of tynA and feaB